MTDKDCPIYKLHQTPPEVCKDLIKYCEIKQDEILYEPFKGDGGWWNVFPEQNEKYYTEIKEGLDFNNFDWTGKSNITILTNPPFMLPQFERRKRQNSFFKILEYFTLKPEVNKICFLCNSACFNSITPNRTNIINDNGFYLQKIVVLKISKWFGSYYLMVYTRDCENESFKYISKVY